MIIFVAFQATSVVSGLDQDSWAERMS